MDDVRRFEIMMSSSPVMHYSNPHDKEYSRLLQLVLNEGIDTPNRTGVDTRAVFGAQAKFDLSQGFPLLTTKKMAWKSMVAELLWFISGNTNVATLAKAGCKFWHKNGYAHYLKKRAAVLGDKPLFKFPELTQYEKDEVALTFEEWSALILVDPVFANVFADLGDVYGAQWRRWKTNWSRTNHGGFDSIGGAGTIDQLKVITDRIKTNPEDRRLIVTAWDPAEVDHMALPPCHCLFQFRTRVIPTQGPRQEERFSGSPQVVNRALDLMMTMRSADSFLGIPVNIASYALLLSLTAKSVGMEPGVLTVSFGDLHIYHNHLEQVREQLTRSSFPAPTVVIDGTKSLFDYTAQDILLVGYESHPAIKGDMAV